MQGREAVGAVSGRLGLHLLACRPQIPTRLEHMHMYFAAMFCTNNAEATI